LYQNQNPFDVAEKQYQPEQQENEKETGFGQRVASFGSHALGAVPALTGNIQDMLSSGSQQAVKLRKSVTDKLGMKFEESPFPGNKVEETISAPFKFVLGKLPNSEDVNKFIDTSF